MILTPTLMNIEVRVGTVPGLFLFIRWLMLEASGHVVCDRPAVEARGADGEIKSSGGVKCSNCLLYTSPSPRDGLLSRMPSSA